MKTFLMASLIFVIGLAPALATAQVGGTGVGSGAPGAPAGDGTGVGAAAPGRPVGEVLAQQTSPPPPSNPAPGTDVSGAKSLSGVQIDSKSLVGSAVRAEDGKDVGKVANVMIDPSEGKVTALVVTMNRTVGVGGMGVTLNGKDITVPWNGVKVGRDRDTFVVTLLQGTLPTTESSSTTR